MGRMEERNLGRVRLSLGQVRDWLSELEENDTLNAAQAMTPPPEKLVEARSYPTRS